jgi:hypothetical protein
MSDAKKPITGSGNVVLPALRVAGSGLVLTGYPPKVVVSENSPILWHASRLLVLGDYGENGETVLGHTPVFWELQKYIAENGIEALHSLLPKDGRLFEELIAGAYKSLGAKIVELSPRSGDGGVDVWATYEIPAAGNVTLMDQVKLYAAGREVASGDVHRILSADSRGNRFSKAVLSTTGKIPPVVRKEVETYGERVILRDASELERLFSAMKQY